MITIHGELYSSKNSRRILKVNGRTIVAKSAKSKSQEQDHAIQLQSSKRMWNKMVAGKAYPLRVGFRVYRRTEARFDWANIIQGLCDAMVKAGYLPDDSAGFLTPVYLGYSKDAQNPRTEIEVL